MKKISMIFAMAVLALTSCIKEETPMVDNNGGQDIDTPSELLVEKVFTVGDVDTRTYIDGTTSASNKMVIKWCADDQIAVWDGTAFRKFTVDGEPNGNSATFKGMVSESATEFYAIYPYNDNLKYNYNESQQWMEFAVTQPYVQYANPEGGLADNTAFSCGKADADGHIQFVNRSALLKFSLAEGMTVKSVTIKGNEDDDIISGSLNIRYNASNNFTLGWKSEGKSNELTLANEDGSNLKTGVDYYIALTGNIFGKGYSVTATFADGTSMTRSSDKSIQFMSNQIYTLSSKPISRVTLGAKYYDAYQAGEDIVIGGKIYNKTTHPNAKLLTETTTISSDGLYFLAPAEGQTITLGTTRVADIAIIGNDPSQKVTLTHSGARMKAGATAFVAMNLVFPDAGQQLIQENDYVDYVAFDNCTIYPTKASSGQVCYNGTTAATAMKEFVMVNCDYVFSKDAATRDGSMILNCVIKDSNVTLKNNLFYINDPDVATWKFKIASVPGKMNKLVMSGNTFVNIIVTGGDTGYFKSGVDFTSMEVCDNLFYVSQSTVGQDGKSKNQFVFNGTLTPTAINVDHNAYYQVSEITTEFNMFGTTPEGQKKTPTKLSASPFSSMDHTNGVFVKTADAAAYGANR